MSGLAPLRVVVIAPLRFPIRRPHAGGLESAVWNEVDQLRARGHDVTLIAAEGSDWLDERSEFTIPAMTWPGAARPTDDSYPPSYAARSVPALDRALDRIAATAGDYDVISNHCLHGLPLERAGDLGVPMISTLHTPVDDALVASHAAARGRRSEFLAVSEHTRLQWADAGIESTVLANAVDPQAWPLGPGGPDLVWFGRIVPEKAPHLAIEVAQRLGRGLVIAGRIGDELYADRAVLPHVGGAIRYVGQLSPVELAHLVGRSAALIATPVWEEPFGLVAPEALMTGTPVVSFAMGGVSEIAAGSVGMVTVPPGDVAALAKRVEHMIVRASREPGFRPAIRSSAEARFSLPSRISALERRFRSMLDASESASEQAA
ncbi:MAG: glycosyltransferase [Leifsonia flava]